MTKSKNIETPIEDVIIEKAKELEGEMKKSLDRTSDFVKDNPLVSLLGAFALGYLVAKLTQRRKS